MSKTLGILALLATVYFALWATDVTEIWQEQDPEIGQVWIMRSRPAQPYWPDLWDTRILDVKAGLVHFEQHGFARTQTVNKFKMLYNYARPDTTFAPQ